MQSNLLHQRGLYQKQLINHKIKIPFEQISKNVEEYFIDYAKNNIMNQCEKEGYISDHSCKIINYSIGKTISSYVIYDVLFEFMVCYPYEDMTFNCKVQSITKIGIKGILTHDPVKNPFIIFASYLHNPSIFDQDNSNQSNENRKYNIGDIVNVRVLGHRFEINDPSIYVLVEIINKTN